MKESIIQILQCLGQQNLVIRSQLHGKSIVRKWTETSRTINSPCDQLALRPAGERYCPNLRQHKTRCFSEEDVCVVGLGHKHVGTVYLLITWPLLVIMGTFEHGSPTIFATFMTQPIRRRVWGTRRPPDAGRCLVLRELGCNDSKRTVLFFYQGRLIHVEKL